MTLDKDVGIDLLNAAIDQIKSCILSKGGKMEIKMSAKAVSAKEESELQQMMDRLAAENEEVDGDDDEEEDKEGGGGGDGAKGGGDAAGGEDDA